MEFRIWDYLSTEGFQPHGMCLLWRPDVFWTHVVSDLVIALSYFSIPGALVYLAARRSDLVYRWVLYLFGAFIVACGITHLFGIWTMWVPDYSVEAVVKVLTAIVSVATAIALWPLMPKLLVLPSTRQLEEKNAALAHEIAERRAAETELKSLNGQLERRVSERTESLEKVNAILSEARAAADRANTAKSDFLAAMSHEIRTPLNGILGMASIMREGDLNAGQCRQLDTIRRSGNLLLTLLNDILDLSKIEAGRLEIETIDFDVAAMMDSVAELWSPKAQAQGLTYTQTLDPVSCTVLRSDPTRIRQILFNLLSNALKFTDRGDIAVTVSQTGTADDRLATRFEVRDSGEGIAPDKRDLLFRKFIQADSSVTRKHGGTGLGLAISKELAEAMGGEIGVESVEGEGSTFWFTIVCPEGDADRAVGDVDRVDTDGTRKVLRILVAEDNHVNQIVVQAMLESVGHSVDIVGNGIEAVDAVIERPYDVVLMDVQMPEMDGVSATRRIRALSGDRKNIPIIALTANAMKGDREKYLDAGMNDYVSKPIDRRTLTSALQRQCGGELRSASTVRGARGKVGNPDADLPENLSALLHQSDRETG